MSDVTETQSIERSVDVVKSDDDDNNSKNEQIIVVPLHELPKDEYAEIVGQVCDLLNSEWPRSRTLREKSLHAVCFQIVLLLREQCLKAVRSSCSGVASNNNNNNTNYLVQCDVSGRLCNVGCR
jgi:hypothetical protein